MPFANCPSCGKLNSVKLKKCPKCGAMLIDQSQPEPASAFAGPQEAPQMPGAFGVQPAAPQPAAEWAPAPQQPYQQPYGVQPPYGGQQPESQYYSDQSPYSTLSPYDQMSEQRFCYNCGTMLAPGTVYCPNCGMRNDTPPYDPNAAMPRKRNPYYTGPQ